MNIKIVVEGGVVQGVWTDQHRFDVGVEVIDIDNLEAEGKPVPQIPENFQSVY